MGDQTQTLAEQAAAEFEARLEQVETRISELTEERETDRVNAAEKAADKRAQAAQILKDADAAAKPITAELKGLRALRRQLHKALGIKQERAEEGSSDE